MLGYFSFSAVCKPDFYSSSSFISKFNVTVMSFNLLPVTFTSIGYVLIFIKRKITNSEKLSESKPGKENIMLSENLYL